MKKSLAGRVVQERRLKDGRAVLRLAALVVMLAGCASLSDGSTPGADEAAIETTVADAVIGALGRALPSMIEAVFGERITP